MIWTSEALAIALRESPDFLHHGHLLGRLTNTSGSVPICWHRTEQERDACPRRLPGDPKP